MNKSGDALIVKTIVLVRDDECRVYGSDKTDAAGVLADARYWFLRRIEKDGWEAHAIYIADTVDKSLIEQWLDEESKREREHQRELDEHRDRAEYERLSKKYGDGR
jgi:hypothetical protein